MDDRQDVAKAEAAVAEAESRVGKDHIEVSYKLDVLADALKADGRTLQAANAKARAKAIRMAQFVGEAAAQEKAYGDVSGADQPRSATAWLYVLRKGAMIAAGVVVVLSIILPGGNSNWMMAKDLVGSSAAAAFFQLMLFPVKSIPRIMKYVIVMLATSAVWALIELLPNHATSGPSLF